jgi:hypothetical protein
MAQSGFTPIKLYSSTTPAAAPTAGNLEQGELAINTSDGKLFYEDSSGVVQVIATKDTAAGTFSSAVINANSTSDALRITQTGTGNALVVEDSANPDSSPFVIDASGNLIKGNTAVIQFPDVQGTQRNIATQVIGNSFAGSAVGIGAFINAGEGVSFTLAQSRSATVGSHTVVDSGDTVGVIQFAGSDGTNFIRLASIEGEVDGTPGTADMPGRLVVSTTADGASSPTERMRIDNAGRVGVGATTLGGASGQMRLSRDITGAVQSLGFRSDGVVQSGVTTQADGIWSGIGTAAASFTLNNLFQFTATQGSFGAGSSVVTQAGFVASNNLTGATNNYGFYSNIASGTGRWNFYANGTADNYFAGNVGIGAESNGEKLVVLQSVDITAGATSPGAGGANSGTIKLNNSGTLTQAEGTLATGIAFTGTGANARRRALIASYQSGTNANQTGLKFFVNPLTTTSTDVVVEALAITHGGGLQISRTAVTAPAATDGNVFSGTYTPTLTNTTNVASSTASGCQYMRVGNVVTVSGQVAVTPTATGNTILGISLPIASNFSGSQQLGGTALAQTTTQGVVLYGDAINDRAVFRLQAAATTALTYHFSFTYQVV